MLLVYLPLFLLPTCSYPSYSSYKPSLLFLLLFAPTTVQLKVIANLSRRTRVAEEPLYDTVAAEEEQEDEYDNHLLYGRGGEKRGEREKASLSSTGGEGSLTSPSLARRGLREEEEGNYVNIQYFLTHTQVRQSCPVSFFIKVFTSERSPELLNTVECLIKLIYFVKACQKYDLSNFLFCNCCCNVRW